MVLENDDSRFSVVDILWVHERTGIPLVFDNLHHRLNNPANLLPRDALKACLATWPEETRPKIHFSTPRTEWMVAPDPATGEPKVRQARWSRHSDYVNPFEFIDFVSLAEGLRTFDVMLEVRAKDLALLQLRRDLVRFAPGLTALFEDRGPADSSSRVLENSIRQ